MSTQERNAPPTRLIIADPGLNSDSGHHYTYTEATVRAASAAALPSVVWAHRQIPAALAQSLNASPVFQLGPYGGFFGATSAIGRCLHANAITADNLKDAPLEVTPNDLIFFHTVSDDALLGIATWLAEFPAQHRPRVEVLLRFHPAVHGDAATRVATYGIGLAALSRLQKWVAFSTDTNRLAEWFKRAYGINCRLLPIPHVVRPNDSGLKSGAPIVGLFPGNARVDRGFSLLPALAKELLSRKTPVRLLVQAARGTEDPNELQVIAELERMPEIAAVVRGPLSIPDYYNLISSASFLLLPYDKARYAHGTSGVFAEGMVAGKPVITTADTWMTDEAKRLGGVVFAVERLDPDALADAVEMLVREFPKFSEIARTAAPGWHAEHNEQNLLRCLLNGISLTV